MWELNVVGKCGVWCVVWLVERKDWGWAGIGMAASLPEGAKERYRYVWLVGWHGWVPIYPMCGLWKSFPLWFLVCCCGSNRTGGLPQWLGFRSWIVVFVSL